MKFTANQLEFLMTKMTIDVDSFVKDAEAFVPAKRPRVKKPAETGEIVKCSMSKKDGNPCLNRARNGGLCGKHSKPVDSEVVVPALSDEVVVDSGSDM